MADTNLTDSEVAAQPIGDPTAKPALTRAKTDRLERPVVTRSGDSDPVFDADKGKLAAQSNGNSKALSKPAPTPTRATAVNMLLTSWSEMKMKFADFDHQLDMDNPAEAELQDVIDFVQERV